MAEDDSSPPKPKDWSLYEKPYYTIAEVVRYWCELPDDYAMALDRHRRPLPDPKYPMVKVRTDLLVDAIENYELPHEAAPDKKWDYMIGEGIQPRDQVIRQDALKRWFSGHRWPERPPFLFWREGAEPTAPAPAKRLNPAKLKLLEIVEALEQFAKDEGRPFDRRAMPGPLGKDSEEQGSLHWLCAQIDPIFTKAPTTFEKHRAGICAVEKYATRTEFYREALPRIAPLFKSAGAQGNSRQRE